MKNSKFFAFLPRSYLLCITLVRVYDVIDKHIKLNEAEGKISTADSKKIALDALVRIYEIQQNSKLINAIKTYKVLK